MRLRRLPGPTGTSCVPRGSLRVRRGTREPVTTSSPLFRGLPYGWSAQHLHVVALPVVAHHCDDPSQALEPTATVARLWPRCGRGATQLHGRI